MRPAPLHALHTFEAAARHQSYSLAAGELYVTHSAVSQQIRILEQMFGVRLFERQGKQMLLTQSGLALHKRIQPALQQIQRAVSAFDPRQKTPSITITTLQSLANHWLLPRLAKFQKLRPDVTVQIHASIDLKNLDRSETDIAIRYGRGKWAGCISEKLMDDWLLLVCSPTFNHGRLPKTPASLKKYRVLKDDCQLEWNAWAKSAGMDTTDFMHETRYSDSNLMLAAALSGQGIAIGRSSLVAADLAARRLVRLFDLIVPSPYSYYLVTLPERRQDAHLQALTTWLKEQATDSEKKLRRMLCIAA